MHALPNFRAADFLRAHALAGLAFYDGRCIDPAGGFFEALDDDGRVTTPTSRHLAATARLVIAHAQAALQFPDHAHAMAWRHAVRHGIAFLRSAYRTAGGGLAWLLPVDAGTADPCEAHAWILLAQAHALMAGVAEVEPDMHRGFDHLESRFWRSDEGLYAHGVRDPRGHVDLRSQRANLRACEAMLAAFDATDDVGYLERAAMVADSVTQRVAGARRGRIPLAWWANESTHTEAAEAALAEDAAAAGLHDDVAACLPGHWMHWVRLLLALERDLPGLAEENWLTRRARELFALAVEQAWDRHHGGLVLGLDAQGRPTDGRRLSWVQAEAIAAAAELATRTLEGGYWGWYDRLWDFAWQHLADARHGRWHAGLDALQRPLPRVPASDLGELQALANCHLVLAALER